MMIAQAADDSPNMRQDSSEVHITQFAVLDVGIRARLVTLFDTKFIMNVAKRAPQS